MADVTNQQEEPKNPMGRPLKLKTVSELDAAINAYFKECDPRIAKRMVETGQKADGESMFGLRDVMTEQKPYTVSGLARAMGIDRDTLVKYRKRDEFFGSISAAYDRVHEFTESQLYGKSASGAAFSLKNNWTWRDKQEVDHTTNGESINPVQALTVTELRKLAKDD